MTIRRGIPPELIDEIKQRNNIVSIVEKYVNLEKTSSQNLFGLCPFHSEKTPSFSVSPQKQIFYCFGCHKGGDMITFLMEIEKIGYMEALQILAEQARIELPTSSDENYERTVKLQNTLYQINKEAARYYFKNLIGDDGKLARDYLLKRGIRGSTLKKFGIGYAKNEWDGLFEHLSSMKFSQEILSKSGLFKTKTKKYHNQPFEMYDIFRNRLIFPILDAMGRVVAFGGRVFDESHPKYINSPETPIYTKGRHLYGYHLAKMSKEERLIVVEGYMDAIAIHQAGFDNAVASLGTALTLQQATLLRRHSKEVVIAFDADSSGMSATERGIEILSGKECDVFVLLVPEGKDPDDYIRKNGPERFQSLVRTAKPYLEFQMDMAYEQSKKFGEVVLTKYQELACNVLAKEENEILRELYAGQIAQKMGTSVQAVIAEIERRMKSFSEKGKTFTAKNETSSGVVTPSDTEEFTEGHASKDELNLLCILACTPEIYFNLEYSLETNFFSAGVMQRIAKDAITLLKEKKMSPPALIELAKDDWVNNKKLSDLFASGCMKSESLNDTKERLLEIHRLYSKIQIKYLTEAKERFIQPDYHRLKPEEKKEFQEIQKMIDQLKFKSI